MSELMGLIAPLRDAQGDPDGDRVIGTIGFSGEDDRPYTSEDRAFLQDLADRAALAVENTRLHNAERAARLLAEEAARALRRLAEEAAKLSRDLVGDASRARRE